MDWGTIGEYAQFFATRFWEIVSAPLAQRIYVLAIGIAAICLALLRVCKRKQFLEGVTIEYFEIKRMGRKAVLAETRERHAEEDKAVRRRRARSIWLAVCELFALGVVFPATLLVAGTLFYGWFDPSTAPLLDDRAGTPLHHPSGIQVAGYIADHLLRGGLFDLMEVFKLHASTITNNRDAYGYTLGLFAFHLYVEAFFLFGLASVAKMAFLMPRALRPARL